MWLGNAGGGLRRRFRGCGMPGGTARRGQPADLQLAHHLLRMDTVGIGREIGEGG